MLILMLLLLCVDASAGTCTRKPKKRQHATTGCCSARTILGYNGIGPKGMLEEKE